MGGLPWDVAARDLPVPEAISQRRAALGIPQATPRAQEAPPQAAKRGQGQACGDGQTAPDTQDQSTKRSKSVYNIISTQGWVGVTHRNTNLSKFFGGLHPPYRTQPSSSASFQERTIAVTMPEPKAATRTQAAAISRAMQSRGCSGSPMARARVSTALWASSAIRTRQAAITSKHQLHWLTPRSAAVMAISVPR